MRGGHPEHREPGGGWGADGQGRGPGPSHGSGPGGDVVGRVLQGTPGGAFGTGRPSSGSGPRQEYIDAFDDDVFGKGLAGKSGRPPRAPSPRHPDRGPASASPPPLPGRPLPDPGPAPVRRAAGRRPGTAGPWNGYEDPVAFPRAASAESGPPRQGGGASDSGRPDSGGPDAGSAPPRVPAQMPRTEKGGGYRGRALTGVLAVAVTTVIAFVVATQVTNGGTHADDSADDGGGADRGTSAKGPASRSQKERSSALSAAPSYTEKLSKTYSLDADFKGKGDFKAVPGKDEGAGGSQVMHYRVDVEKGLPLDSGLFAEAVQKTLNDRRSWAHGGERSFERVSKGKADFVITLASSPTTDEWCAKSGLDTSEQHVSCDSASTDRVMINAYRWAQGSKTFGDDRVFAYRQMLINHEVGHRLGRGHVGCEKDGALAPVMMQQTKSLKTGDAKCRPNPWPYPKG
ncbi:DUF3152 domain-containing protein [Streptomyces sp. HNM0575]|nr:DUF3152 domain-containing protein [Streptomyces sp. HNM0575]